MLKNKWQKLQKAFRILLAFAIILGVLMTPRNIWGADNALPPSTLNLTTLSFSDTYYQVQLDWTDTLTNESGYRVERKMDSGSFTLLTTLGYNSVTYIDTYSGDTLGHTFTYRIVSLDAYAIQTIHTNETSTTAAAVVPPNNITVTPVSNTQLDLVWTFPGAKSYAALIERRKSGEAWIPLTRVDSGVTRYSDTGLSPSTTYYYRIRAVSGQYVQSLPFPNDGIGKSAGTMLSAPANLAAYVDASGQVNLTWTYDTNVTSFAVERKRRDQDTYTVIATSYSNLRSYIDASPIPNIWYSYRVRVYIGTTASAYSDVLSINTTYLEEPTGLQVFSAPESGIKLTWIDHSSSETGFEIWRKAGSTGTWENFASVGRNVTTYTDLAIIDGTVYTYKVRAKIGHSEIFSKYSQEASAWAMTMAAPTGLSYTVLSSTSVQLSWTDNATNESGYKVERKEGPDGTWVERGMLAANQTTFTDSYLAQNVQYTYRIQVLDNVYYNTYTYSEELEVKLGTPQAPSGLKAEAVSSSQVKLTWNDNSNMETGFKIERRGYYTDKVEDVILVGPEVTSYVDNKLWQNMKYYYRIRAYSKSGDSAPSNEVSVSTKKEIQFIDVPRENAAWEAITNLTSRGAIKVKTGKAFSPTEKITRGEFISILVKAFKISGTPVGSFADVNQKHAYYKEIMTASKAGLISPNGSNLVYPDRRITREEMVIFLLRALKAIEKPLPAHDVSILDEFPDKSTIAAGALGNMATAFGEKVIDRVYDQGVRKIAPKGSVTRADAAVTVFRTLQIVEK